MRETTSSNFRRWRLFNPLLAAVCRADPPLVPYLGTSLNELSGVVEALPTRLDDELINFSKMRRVGLSPPPSLCV